MMNRIVEYALTRRFLVLGLFGIFMVLGAVGFHYLNIEAYPDPVPPLVDVIAQNPGMSAEEMERYVTIPIEIAMSGIPNVKVIRTASLFGLSDIKLQFTYDFTYRQAEQWVINRLSQIQNLPPGVTPVISPWSPTGEIVRYQVVGPKGYSVTDLKTIQDWMLVRRFKAIPGVIDVNGWGGQTKTYEVNVQMEKLLSYGITFPQLLTVLNNSNVNVGGQTISFGPQAAVVRGVGLVQSMDDMRNTVIQAAGGSPVLLKDVATVSVGHQPRLGIAGRDDQSDVVEGIVLMRRGEQSLPTIQRVEAEMEHINSSGMLPPGVRIERFYDRADLIGVTTHTVLHNMIVGIVLIFFVQWIFLGDLRSALIVAANIPFALFFAVLIMLVRGDSANLLSVGAVDFGLVIDATVIMVENIYRHLALGTTFNASPTLERSGGATFLSGSLATIAKSASEVNQSIFFAATIIIVSFLPLFTMSGVEGHIFGPMAQTYAYAIAGGLIATFTVTPALAAILLKKNVRERETAVVRAIEHLYDPLLKLALKWRGATLSIAAVLFVCAMFAARTLGLEFLPVLEEGNLWIRASLPTSISLEEGNKTVNAIRDILNAQSVVETVVSQNGRPDDGTDPSGFSNAEFFVPLKPFDTWPKGLDKEALTQKLSAEMTEKFPGVNFNFSQYIQDNVAEAASGVKASNSIKLFGNDLATLEATAYEIKHVMSKIDGVADLGVFDSLGQPTVNITVDRARAARYGLMPGDINATIQAAIGGQAAGNLYEPGSDRNFPMVVRLAPEYRGSIDALRRIPIGAQSQNGTVAPIPLADVAEIRLVSGPAFIYREGQARYIPIKFSVRGRDLGSTVLEAQERIANEVKLPGGYRIEWAGEFNNLKEAVDRLVIVVPASLALIALLLFFNFGSLVDTALTLSVMPMAVVGGVLALWLTDTPFSVSAAIGFIGLIGIAVMEGIIVLTYFNQMVGQGMERLEALVQACETRLRPVMMTCIAACVGLLPAAFSTGIGSQVQKPLALVVVGGILLAPILILLVLPVLIALFSRRGRPIATSALPLQATAP